MTQSFVRGHDLSAMWANELSKQEPRREELGTQFGSFKAALLASSSLAFPVILP